VRCMSRDFDVYAPPDGGTVVLPRVGPARPWSPPRPREPVVVGAVESPLRGEPVSGDAWAMERKSGVTTLLVADGLGHGPLAAEAARAAVAAFEDAPGLAPAARVQAIHERMSRTRGAAIAVARIDADAGSVKYSGVGNISAQIVSPASAQSLVTMNGTAGHLARSFREFAYEFPGGSVLVLHSDGVSARWSLDPYPGISLRDPAIVAALLHRDHARGRDDSLVVVARSHANGTLPAGSSAP
jgi:hypothetical protein